MSASHYFQAMFTNFSEHNKDIICIRDVKSTILKLIVDYFYTRKIVISDENVQVIIYICFVLNIHQNHLNAFLFISLGPITGSYFLSTRLY